MHSPLAGEARTNFSFSVGQFYYVDTWYILLDDECYLDGTLLKTTQQDESYHEGYFDLKGSRRCITSKHENLSMKVPHIELLSRAYIYD